MRTSEDRSGPLVTCTGNPCQSTGTSSPVSTGDLPVLPVQVTNGPDRSSEVLITGRGGATKREGGGHVKFYPYEKGGRKKF